MATDSKPDADVIALERKHAELREVESQVRSMRAKLDDLQRERQETEMVLANRKGALRKREEQYPSDPEHQEALVRSQSRSIGPLIDALSDIVHRATAPFALGTLSYAAVATWGPDSQILAFGAAAAGAWVGSFLEIQRQIWMAKSTKRLRAIQGDTARG